MQRAASMSDIADESREAFARMLERHRAIVFKVANTYCRNPDDRNDLAQDIATQLWRAYPKYDPARSFTTWMYRIALNVAIGHVRSESLRKRHDGGPLDDAVHDLADTSVADPEAEQQLHLVQRFIAAQSPMDRALLLLYLDERPQREIAEILGISESNVSTKIGRLKQRIRDEL